MNEVKLDSATSVFPLTLFAVLLIALLGSALMFMVADRAANRFLSLTGICSALVATSIGVFIAISVSDHVGSEGHDELLRGALVAEGLTPSQAKASLEPLIKLRLGEKLVLDGEVLVIRGRHGVFFVGKND